MENLHLLFLGLALIVLGLGLYLYYSRRRELPQEEEDDSFLGQNISFDSSVAPPIESTPRAIEQDAASSSAIKSIDREPGGNSEELVPQSHQLGSDLLTEYEIYLQFGYLDKAAKTLNDYLTLQENPSSKLQSKLLNLYLECKQIDDFSLLLESLFKDKKISADILKMAIISGLKVDLNNLNLRLLAQSELSWGPEEILNEVDPDSAKHKKAKASEKSVQSNKKMNVQAEASTEAPRSNYQGRLMLLNGFSPLNLKLDVEERSTIKGFLEPKAIAKFFMIDGDYNDARLTFEDALAKSNRPMTLLVDVLHLDYLMKNVESFVRHYYQLLIKMGNQGAMLKDQLLKMGLSLGKHPFFADVELVMDNKIEVEKIAQNYAFISDASNYNEARAIKRQPLVVGGDNTREPSEYIDQMDKGSSKQNLALIEAEARLEYGQIEEAIETLEDALYKDPNEEEALYFYLLDLYGRLEDKDRFSEFVRRIKGTGVSLPEEVRLAMDRTERRLH